MGNSSDRSEAPLRSRLERRLLGALRIIASSHSPVDLSYDRAKEYWSDDARWLPERATITVEIQERIGTRHPLREVVVELLSGPDALYRYYPFNCWIYVGNRVASIVEFSGAQQVREARLRIPVGTKTSLTFVSELSGKPEGEERELAVSLRGARAGRIVAAPDPVSLTPQMAFSQDLFSLVPEPPRPIFVIGAYRSGTSVLAWALGQHPNIWPLEETNFLTQLGLGAASGFQRVHNAPRNFFDIYHVSLEEYAAYVGFSIDNFLKTVSLRLWSRINLSRLSGKSEQNPDDAFHPAFQLARTPLSSKRRWVDGTPENAHYIVTLRQLFPASRFILMVRDPFDVIVSMMHFDRVGGAPTSAADAAAMWLRLTAAGLQAYKAFGPSVIRIVPFEDLIGRTERTLARLFTFLKEPDFSQATKTYRKRINSSQVGPQTRKDIVEDLRRTLPERGEVLALYLDLQRSVWEPWERDETAAFELAEIQNDKVMRAANLLD